MVLDDGEIAEIGTHGELIAGGGLYARICRAQRLAQSPTEETVGR